MFSKIASERQKRLNIQTGDILRGTNIMYAGFSETITNLPFKYDLSAN